MNFLENEIDLVWKYFIVPSVLVFLYRITYCLSVISFITERGEKTQRVQWMGNIYGVSRSDSVTYSISSCEIFSWIAHDFVRNLTFNSTMVLFE